jgi:hypothetical protein
MVLAVQDTGMEHVQYVYTFGMDDDEIARRLREEEAGVLALADGSRAYAVPISHHYEAGSLYLRLSDDGDSEKMAFLEGTTDASFVLFGLEDGASWSVLARGDLRPVEESPAPERINEWFNDLRLFGEDVGSVELTVYELRVRELTGRRT